MSVVASFALDCWGRQVVPGGNVGIYWEAILEQAGVSSTCDVNLDAVEQSGLKQADLSTFYTH